MSNKSTILICDDETGIREALKLILENDYQLFFARHGRDALDQVKAHSPDLVIMDVKMPHLNGLDALPKIRQARPQVRILMVTGYESSDVATEAINRGADDYLTKPFAREKLKEKVQALLR